ncbi:MAG: DUF6328 family protein [Pseudolysinimonas sp.]
MDHAGETEVERLDRNWSDILQELRVTQTGTQILLGFLLTIPFQQRFPSLNAEQIVLYLVLVGVAAVATILALTPVALHRALFRRAAKPRLVPLANVLLRLALAAVGLTLSGAVLLTFDLVLDATAAIIAGSITVVLMALGWVLLPLLIRRSPPA